MPTSEIQQLTGFHQVILRAETGQPACKHAYAYFGHLSTVSGMFCSQLPGSVIYVAAAAAGAAAEILQAERVE